MAGNQRKEREALYNYHAVMIQCTFSLCLSGDESLFLCIDALDHSQVCKKVQSQKQVEKKSCKSRSVRFHLAVRFSQVNCSRCRGRDLKFTTTVLIFIHSLDARHNSRFTSDGGSILAGKQFSGGLSLLRAACLPGCSA